MIPEILVWGSLGGTASQQKMTGTRKHKSLILFVWQRVHFKVLTETAIDALWQLPTIPPDIQSGNSFVPIILRWWWRRYLEDAGDMLETFMGSTSSPSGNQQQTKTNKCRMTINWRNMEGKRGSGNNELSRFNYHYIVINYTQESLIN